MIKCKLCKTRKEINDFSIFYINNSYILICNSCMDIIKQDKNKIKNGEYLKNEKEKVSQYNKEYKAKNKDKQSEYYKKYKEKNANKVKEYQKQYYEENKQYYAKYQKEHYIPKKKEKEIKKIKPHKIVNNELNKTKARVRCLINKSFVRKGYKKNTKTQNIIGCDFETLNDHLLQTYKKNYGIEWDGVEPVHIDHIIPLAIANTEEEVIKLCHYTNLQLLKAKDNLLKAAKLT